MKASLKSGLINTFGCLLLVSVTAFFSNCNVRTNTTENSFKWLNGNLRYDTTETKNNIITRAGFLKNYSLTTEFMSDSDFSFFDEGRFSNWKLLRNDSVINYSTDNTNWGFYFYDNDSILQYNNKGSEYYMLFNRPFYCNGRYCNSIGVLIIQPTQQSARTRYYQSDFGDYDLFVNSIRNLSQEYGTLTFPVACENIETDSVCSYIKVDSLPVLK